MIPARRTRLTLVVSLGLLAAGCDGVQFGIIQQGERPPGHDLGLRAPEAEDFEPCSRVGNRVERLDTNHDGKTDLLRVLDPTGKEVCRGVDANLDGKIDTWDVVRDGRVVQRAHDSDGDGKFDQHWAWPAVRRPDCGVMHLDKDGDGRPDPGSPKFDPCGLFSVPTVIVPASASAAAPLPGRGNRHRSRPLGLDDARSRNSILAPKIRGSFGSNEPRSRNSRLVREIRSSFQKIEARSDRRSLVARI